MKKIINKIRKNNKVERKMYRAKVLNLCSKEIEIVEATSEELSNLVCYTGCFDVIEMEEI